MVEMVMQQLAAAPPRAMGQMPELKFVNEAGKRFGGTKGLKLGSGGEQAKIRGLETAED